MSKEPKEKKTFLNEALDFAKDLVIIVLVVLFIRTFFVVPFQISGQSMYDAYYDWEFIIVDRFSYLDIPMIKRWKINRWDVVVFKPWVSEDKEFFIKRIIWLPWETLKIEKWFVYLLDNNSNTFEKIDEWYLDNNSIWNTYIRNDKSKHIYEIPEWEYFVMWDNRKHSTDSRTCFRDCIYRSNYVKKDTVIGKVFIDLWYFNFRKFAFFHPTLRIDTHPKFFSSTWTYNYN